MIATCEDGLQRVYKDGKNGFEIKDVVDEFELGWVDRVLFWGFVDIYYVERFEWSNGKVVIYG